VTCQSLDWAAGSWSHDPESAVAHPDGTLVVTATAGSDAWRTTYYGFVHESEHALLTPAEQPAGYEVDFTLDFEGNFDQAGLMIAAGPQEWIKTGVEVTDGAPHAGAVVTRGGLSDWSVLPVPEWTGRVVTIRASLDRDAVVIRARLAADPGSGWQLLRVAPLPTGGPLRIGPFVAAPETTGLTVTFHRFAVGPADESLH
jgi:regulation of enolase protein 1 (concanavalin A-like superfamily)